MTAKAINRETKIGVLCGGLSSEREVSLRSGANCEAALKRLGYQHVRMIDVGRDIASVLADEPIDVAYLALHGKFGEDGCVQGLLEMLGVPYTGNRVTASALTMNKDLTKTVLAAAGLPVIPSVTVHAPFPELSDDRLNAIRDRFPVMVKPLNEGSSIGMSKVNTLNDLPAALEEAGKYSPDVMIEPFIKGTSITVGVIDINGQPTVTPILEFRTKTEWYDLEAKYTEGLTEFILPAELPDDVTNNVQRLTLAAHRAAGCHGVSRTDFMIDAQGQPWILEINSIPGMTNLSDLPAQAKAMGINYDQLVEYILMTACSA